MKLIGVINGWPLMMEAPGLWRGLLWPPLRIRREPVLIETEAGKLAIQEAPAVYSIQVLGVVLFIEFNRGMTA